MVHLLSSIVSLVALSRAVSGHGFLKNIEVNGVRYPAWQVFQDDYVTPEPVRYARKITDNGPVPDFTGPDIT
jgi:adenine-specific DNA methylase